MRMSVDVNPSRDPGPLPTEAGNNGAVPSAFSVGKPRMLFEGPYLPAPFPVANYYVSPDGQRFLMIKPSVEEQARHAN